MQVPEPRKEKMVSVIGDLDESQPSANPIQIDLGNGRFAIIAFDTPSNAWCIMNSEGNEVAILRKGLSGTWHVMGGMHPGYSHNLQTTIIDWLNLNDDLL